MLLEEISVRNSLTYFKYFKSSMKWIWQNVVEHRLLVLQGQSSFLLILCMLTMYYLWIFIKIRTEEVFHYQEQLKINELHMLKNSLGKNHKGM